MFALKFIFVSLWIFNLCFGQILRTPINVNYANPETDAKAGNFLEANNLKQKSWGDRISVNFLGNDLSVSAPNIEPDNLAFKNFDVINKQSDGNDIQNFRRQLSDLEVNLPEYGGIDYTSSIDRRQNRKSIRSLYAETSKLGHTETSGLNSSLSIPNVTASQPLSSNDKTCLDSDESAGGLIKGQNCLDASSVVPQNDNSEYIPTGPSFVDIIEASSVGNMSIVDSVEKEFIPNVDNSNFDSARMDRSSITAFNNTVMHEKVIDGGESHGLISFSSNENSPATISPTVDTESSTSVLPTIPSILIQSKSDQTFNKDLPMINTHIKNEFSHNRFPANKDVLSNLAKIENSTYLHSYNSFQPYNIPVGYKNQKINVTKHIEVPSSNSFKIDSKKPNLSGVSLLNLPDKTIYAVPGIDTPTRAILSSKRAAQKSRPAFRKKLLKNESNASSVVKVETNTTLSPQDPIIGINQPVNDQFVNRSDVPFDVNQKVDPFVPQLVMNSSTMPIKAVPLLTNVQNSVDHSAPFDQSQLVPTNEQMFAATPFSQNVQISRDPPLNSNFKMPIFSYPSQTVEATVGMNQNTESEVNQNSNRFDLSAGVNAPGNIVQTIPILASSNIQQPVVDSSAAAFPVGSVASFSNQAIGQSSGVYQSNSNVIASPPSQNLEPTVATRLIDSNLQEKLSVGSSQLAQPSHVPTISGQMTSNVYKVQTQPAKGFSSFGLSRSPLHLDPSNDHLSHQPHLHGVPLPSAKIKKQSFEPTFKEENDVEELVPCTCGVFLSGQFIKGSRSEPNGNPVVEHHQGQKFPCSPGGKSQCQNKCLDLMVKHLPNSGAIICGSIDRDIYKEKAYLWVKNCQDVWVNTNLSSGKDHCCKDNQPIKCSLM